MSDPTLAALVDAFADAKAEADAAADRLRDARDRLLTEHAAVTTWQAGNLYGKRATLAISQRSSWRIDSTRLKVEHPEVYAAYAKQSHSMTVTVVS